MKSSKFLKFIVVALIAMSTFAVSASKANAQVRVSIGHRPVHHRVVVVKRRPIHHRKVVIVRHHRVRHHRY